MANGGEHGASYADQLSEQQGYKASAMSTMDAAEGVPVAWPDYEAVLQQRLIRELRHWNKSMNNVKVPVSYWGLRVSVWRMVLMGALLLQYPRAWAIRAEKTILWWRVNWKQVLRLVVILVAIVTAAALAGATVLFVISNLQAIIDFAGNIATRLLELLPKT